MTGNKAGSYGNKMSDFQQGLRWDDPAQTVPINHMVELLSGRPYRAAGKAGSEQLTVPVIVPAYVQAPAARAAQNYSTAVYVPKDDRPWNVRRQGRKAYKKASKHYGKTYVLTRAQVWWLVVLWLGSVLLASSAMYQFWVFMAERTG